MKLNNQQIFDSLFWIFILPIILCVKSTAAKFLIFCFGIIHAFFAEPWPPITLMLAYPATIILFANGYKQKCYLSMAISIIIFIGHYLKDSGIVDFYYFPS